MERVKCYTICWEHSFARLCVFVCAWYGNAIYAGKITHKKINVNSQCEPFTTERKRLNKRHRHTSFAKKLCSAWHYNSFTYRPKLQMEEKASPLYLILSNSWIKQLLFIACQVNKKANKSQVPNNRHNLPPFELIFHSPARCFFLSLFVTPIRTRTVHVRIVHVDTLARNCRWPFYSADVLKLFRFIFALTSR